MMACCHNRVNAVPLNLVKMIEKRTLPDIYNILDFVLHLNLSPKSAQDSINNALHG